MKKFKKPGCPKCRRMQYYQCGNPDCSDKRIPKDAKPQIVHADLDALECPYCGFTAHVDYWEDRDMTAAWKYDKGHNHE